jgi:hypothetical protein
MEPDARTARWLLWTTYLGFPVLVAFYVGTGWDGALHYGRRYVNPLSWGFSPVLNGCQEILRGAGGKALADLVSFYRSNPWGNWVLVDHMGLKVLLSFFMAWEARASRRRVWPYIVALYVVGALAPLLFFLPKVRAACRAEERRLSVRSAAVGVRP